jgi:hypothetical protein
MRTPRWIFVIWSGENAMSEQRLDCYHSIRENCSVPVILVHPGNVLNFVNYLPPFYDQLSFTHRSDYLRAALMWEYGGGYTDIKHNSDSWVNYFNELDGSPGKVAIGYPEISPEDTPVRELRPYFSALMGNGRYIFKPRSTFAKQWLDACVNRCESKIDALKRVKNPKPQARVGDGTNYPLRWAEILGEVFHPLSFRYRDQVLLTMPRIDTTTAYR